MKMFESGWELVRFVLVMKGWSIRLMEVGKVQRIPSGVIPFYQACDVS